MFKYLIGSLVCLFVQNSMAQIHGGFIGGLNVGAPIPKKITKGSKGSFGINPCLGVFALKKIHPKVDIQMGVFVEHKSASYFSPVAYDYIVVAGDSIDNFSGKVNGRIQVIYVQVPIDFSYKFNKKWSAQIGYYQAFKLKGKHIGDIKEGKAGFNGSFVLPDSSFNESRNIKPIDLGIRAGMAYHIGKNLSLQLILSKGIVSFNKPTENFKDKIYTVYSYLNLAYQFSKPLILHKSVL